METNYFGTVRTCQLTIPHMRKAGSGTIVNITSSAGIHASTPTLGPYSATKHAVEALTETLAIELAAQNIRVINAAPGAIRTAFNSAGVAIEPSETYREMIEQVQAYMRSQDGHQAGDPVKMAQRIVEVVDGTGLVVEVVGRRTDKQGLLKLPLGKDMGAIQRAIGHAMIQEADALEGIWASVDVDESAVGA